jgi:hypothetical protein
VIYICIPAHDEAQTVGVLLWKVRRVMAEFARDYHLLVLDDASTDATAEVLEPYAKVVPLTILRSQKRLGYAGALERLLREAVRISTHPKRDVVVTLQADFTESPDHIPGLIRKMEGGADVVGSVPAVQPSEVVTRAFRWSLKGLPFLLPRASVPKEAGHPLSGFRAYRVNALRRAFQDRGDAPLLRTDGWAANAELLMAVLPHARRADQAEVAVRHDRRDRVTRFKAWPTAKALWALARSTPRRPVLSAAAAQPAAPPQAPAERQPQPQSREQPRAAPRPSAAPAPSAAEIAPPVATAQDAGTATATRPPRPRRKKPRAQDPAKQQGDVPQAAAGNALDDVTQAAPASSDAAGDAPAKPPRPRRPRRPRKQAAQGDAPADAAPAPADVAEDAAPAEGAEGTRRRRRPRGRRKPRQQTEGEPSNEA